MQTEHEPLLADADIANHLRVSRSWVRKQRFNRRHDLPHVLDIDPVMIGSLPRYRASDMTRWLAKLTGGR